MTKLRVLNPRNMLIILCVIALVLIGVKGVNISRKISAVTHAEQLYNDKQLVEAEDWYQKAHRNRWIDYKEQEIAARLQELAPITSIKEQLLAISQDVEAALSDSDFESFMNTYKKQQDVRNSYVGNNSPFEAYYREISESYDISDSIIAGFEHFKKYFDEQMTANLEQDRYEDESFKANLLRIPDLYYGGAEKKSSLLANKFESYDGRKLSRIGASGQFNHMLDEASSMLRSYEGLEYNAPWLPKQVESITSTVLQKDADQDHVENYIAHAKAYTSFAENAGIKSSIAGSVEKQISSWMKKAERYVSAGEYEAAIKLYTDLAPYRDTKADIQAAQLAWAVAEPVRLLKSADPNQNYSHVVGGGNRFGTEAYAAGVDDSSRVYFASWEGGDESVRVLTSSPIPPNSAVTSLTIEDALSKKKPVLLLVSESATREATYTLLQVTSKEINTQFQVEADSLELVGDNKIRVTNPNMKGAEGGVATYRLFLGQYIYTGMEHEETAFDHEGNVDTYAGAGRGHGHDKGSVAETGSDSGMPREKGYRDIHVNDLTKHQHEKVRFSCELVEGGDGAVYAVMGDSFIALNGDLPQTSGTLTVMGSFNSYTEVLIGDQLVNIPSFDVEAVE
ncbi:hypothetical protein [Paenibacillus marinisediminis]